MKGLRRGLILLVSGFLLIGLITGIAWSLDIYVTPPGSGDGSIGNPTNLQGALNMALLATEDVTIYLHQGTYTSGSTFTYAVTGTNTNAVKLSGGWDLGFTAQSADNTLTVLEGQLTKRVLKVTGDGTGVNFTFTIENLTIQNGLTTTYVAPPGDPGYGAGILVNNYNNSQLKLIINNCLFQQNNASSTYSAVGGAIFITCDYEIHDSTFSWNQAYHYGGAIFSTYAPPYTQSLSPVIDNCTFDSNMALNAGGAHIYNAVSPVITNSKFLGLSNGASSGGSSISSVTGSFLMLENCIFSGNVTNWWSGAIQFWDASGNITNTLFINNKAGAGVYQDGAGGVMDILWNAAATQPVVNITNCTFAGNRTLGYQGYGGAITNRGAALTIINSIFWDNGGSGIYFESGLLSITYSDIQGGWSGAGNINSNPTFVDAAGEDYRLQKGSPCIDKGNNSVPGLPSTDLAGNVRIYNNVVDMGAYEAQPIIGVSPGSLEFGDVVIGNNPDKTITVQSYGTIDLVLGTISSPSSPFSIKSTGLTDCTNGQTLAPGQSCTITIEFQTASALGPYSTSFDIPSNDPDQSTVTVPLSGTAVYIDPIFPTDKYECTACSIYNSLTLQWDTNATFKSVVVQFSLESTPEKNVKLKASSKAIPLKQLSISSASWKKIILLPGVAGGKVVWKIIGTEGDAAKTTLESPTFSMWVEVPYPVGNMTISSVSISGPLPTLSWQNNCAVKFKAWFGTDPSFSNKTKKAFSFKVANPNDNGGLFTQQLTSSQWASIMKLVTNSTTTPLYWYVESWDGLKRYSKTDVAQFTLSP